MATVIINTFESYMTMVRNSVRGETHLFRNVIATVDGEKKDILRDGALSCGFFASGILYLNKLIGDMHTGVAGLERDLAASGWKQISEPREGAVLVWEARQGASGAQHAHIGFALGHGRAISNGSNTTLVPEEHDETYDGTRAIDRIWWNVKLEQ